MKLWIYILRRALLVIPIIIGVMTVTWAVVSALPLEQRLTSTLGESKLGYSSPIPCSRLGLPPHCGPGGSNLTANPAVVRGEQELGLDKPPLEQWAIYINQSLTLHWGYTDRGSDASSSFSLGGPQNVTTVLGWYLPYTLELAALSLVLILVLAIPIGNLSAVYRNRPFDQGARILSFSGFALPGFLLGTLLLFAVAGASGGSICGHQAPAYQAWYGSWPPQACFPNGVYYSTPAYTGSSAWMGTHLNTSPTGFPTLDAAINGHYTLAADTLLRLLLPAVVIAYTSIAGILRYVRNSMLEVMNLDFVRTARAKGVPEGAVISRHAGRNSLNVTVTVLGLTFAGFLGGFPIIEDVFGLHGIGLILTQAIGPAGHPDLGLIFGTTLLFTIIVVAANIIVDVLYAYLDPRVRLG